MEARALLQAAKRGEMEALEELCRLYHPRLCRYAYALTRSREEAEDVAQEALVAMLRALPDFRGADAGKFEGWLLRIARNRVYSEARRKRPAPIPEGFEPPDPAPLAARLLAAGGPGRPPRGAPSHGYSRKTPRRAAPPSSPLPRRPERPRYRPRKLRVTPPSGRAAPRRLPFVRAERPGRGGEEPGPARRARPPPPAGGRAGSRRSGGPHPRAAAAAEGRKAGRPPPSGREPRPGTCGLHWLRLPPLPAPQARARAAANGNGRGGGVRAHRARRDAARRCAALLSRPRPARRARARARPRLPTTNGSARPRGLPGTAAIKARVLFTPRGVGVRACAVRRPSLLVMVGDGAQRSSPGRHRAAPAAELLLLGASGTHFAFFLCQRPGVCSSPPQERSAGSSWQALCQLCGSAWSSPGLRGADFY